jgi:hypothetical protein
MARAQKIHASTNMNLSSLVVLALAFVSSPASALLLYPRNTLCVFAVSDILGRLRFEGPGDPENKYIGLCQNRLSVASLYASSKRYCTVLEVEAGIHHLASQCQQRGPGAMVTESDVSEYLTNDVLRNTTVIAQAEIADGETLASPIILSKEWHELSRKTQVCSTCGQPGASLHQTTFLMCFLADRMDK